jgi:hypothetical protein
MAAKHESENRPEKRSGRLERVVISVAVLLAIVLSAKYVGRWAGRQLVRQSVQQESISQNAPTGFMGAKWLMSMSDAKRLFPDAIESGPDRLMFERTAFSRPAFISFKFDHDLLIMIIITFKGEKTEGTYRQTQELLVQEYGTFPEPKGTGQEILASEKRIGRVVIQHHLYQQMGMTIEQVTLYRTKENL